MAQQRSLDDFNRWKVEDLRRFVSERGLTVGSKRKAELVALAFAASEQNLPIVPNKEASKQQVNIDYESLLKVVVGGNMCIITDPWKITDGWEDETTAVGKWPPCSYANISEYLLDHDQRALLSRLANDYKEGKAFSYFASQQAWIQDVWYHELSAGSPVCVLKTLCTPSQRMSDDPHKLWAILVKSTGEVKSAYCSCFAGLGSTCNHVGALLFKLDYALQQGLTASRPSTSQPNLWLAPKLKNPVPVAAKDMVLKKPRYGKAQSTAQTQSAARRLFDPTPRSQQTSSVDSVTAALYSAFPDAAAFQYAYPVHTQQYLPESDVNVGHTEVCETTVEIPQPLFQIAQNFQSVTCFLANLPTYSSVERSAVEQATRQQAECAQWFNQRRGRISASISHSVKVAMLKVTDGQLSGPGRKLVETIVNRPAQLQLRAFRYGHENEPVAAGAYLELQREHHSNLQVSTCGLFLDEEHPFLCASPDRTVKCDCCGEGLLEIKCPISCRSQDPKEAGLPYLLRSGDELTLRKTHKYYSQVQTQMGVTGCTWCDFFVYSPAGYFMERVFFDSVCWSSLRKACTDFFHFAVAPKLVEVMS